MCKRTNALVYSKHARTIGQQSFSSVLVYFYMRTLQLYLGLYAGSIMYIRVQYSRTNGPTKGDFGNWNFFFVIYYTPKKNLLFVLCVIVYIWRTYLSYSVPNCFWKDFWHWMFLKTARIEHKKRSGLIGIHKRPTPFWRDRQTRVYNFEKI